MKIAILGHGKMGKADKSILSDRGDTIFSKSNITYKNITISADITINYCNPSSEFNNIDAIQNKIPFLSGNKGWLNKSKKYNKKLKKKNMIFYTHQTLVLV